jgi:hypothetical protein
MKTSKELKQKANELDTLLVTVYSELTKDGKEYSFIRKVLDDEDINDPSEEAMWWELTSRGDENELPIIEMRNQFSGDVFDAHVLSVDNTGITYIPVLWDDATSDIEVGGRLSEVATTWSKIYLIEKMENL